MNNFRLLYYINAERKSWEGQMADTAQFLDNLIAQIDKDILELEQGTAIFSKPPYQDQERMEWCIKTAVTFKTTKEAAVKLRGTI